MLNPNKTKPQAIINLEELYGIKLEEKETLTYEDKNYYSLDKNSKVITLNLYKKNLTKIPNLDDFVNLKGLYLIGDQISKIENLEKLTNLTTLFLTGNQISKIENLEKLTNLTTLFLSGNQISKIENLEKLTNLTTLYLNNNQISKIENLEKLIKIENLKDLWIFDNPFEKDFPEIKFERYENNLKTVKNYFKLKKAIDKINRKPVQKVMLVGNHASGKSTFLHYFLNNIISKKTTSTHILNIEKYPKNSETQAIFYDFGGQDYYHGIYKAFMTNKALNLIFWKNTADNNGLGDDTNGGETQNFNRGYWIKQIEHFGKENSSWLIQNYFNKDKREALTDDKLQELISDEYHISLTNPIKPNLIALKDNLKAYMEEVEEIEISQSYYKFIKEHILNQTSYQYVDVNELEKAFDNKAKIDFKEQLHQLSLQGVILYYKGISELKDIVWLNPQAIVKHIHEEIFEKQKMTNYNGVVPQKEFEKICKDEKIRLMLKHNKVIYFDTVEEKYIIPSYLLRANKDGDEFFYFTNFTTPSFVLKFEYFIPFGFINQLICFYGDTKEKKTYWRDMLLFTVNERKTQILIKLNFEKLTIEVFVSTKEDNQKEVSKNIFDDIFALYGDVFGYRSKLLLSEPDFNDGEPLIGSVINEINYPDDMYLSLDNKYFVHYNTLNDETKTKESIFGYEIDEQKILGKTKAKSLFTRNFAYLAPDNKGLKQMKKIFVSYSRKDADYRDELRNHLNMLSIFDIADNWACEDITIGKWDEQIQKELIDSDIVIYMLSANFFSSPYIREKEVLAVMKQMKENKDKKILPVIVSEFVGLNTLENLIDNPTEVQKAMLDISNYQFLPYGNVWNHLKNQNEEKIISLEEHRKNQTLNSALAQICNAIIKLNS